MTRPIVDDARPLLEFLYRLGQAFLASGEQTAKVELLLRRAASAYGIRRSRVVAFPTAIFITLYEGDVERVTLAEGPTQTLRLDQIADIYELGALAQLGKIPPRDGMERLTAILKKEPRFGAVGTVLGHVILSVGLALLFTPNLLDLGAVAFLGAVVGLLKLLNRDRPILAVPMPVVAAMTVSALVFLAAKYGLAIDPERLLVSPLVSFLPGAMLTLGMVELAYGDMVSGSSRLTTGFVQLVLLAFGIAAGAAFVGIRTAEMVEYAVALPDAVPWAQWVGVVVFGVGVFLHFSAPRHSLGWLLLALLITFAAQKMGTHVFRSESAGGFFGMLVATPLGYLIQLKFGGPPTMVTFLPSFWLMVPGALGLVSVKQMLTDRAAGIDGLTSALFALASISLGTLMGASIYKEITERFDWWQLQIGRVGRRFRRKK